MRMKSPENVTWDECGPSMNTWVPPMFEVGEGEEITKGIENDGQREPAEYVLREAKEVRI